MTGDTILVLGAAGQIGTDLVTTLRAIHGGHKVIATDVKEQPGILSEGGPFYQLDVLDAQVRQQFGRKVQIIDDAHRGVFQRKMGVPADLEIGRAHV